MRSLISTVKLDKANGDSTTKPAIRALWNHAALCASLRARVSVLISQRYPEQIPAGYIVETHRALATAVTKIDGIAANRHATT